MRTFTLNSEVFTGFDKQFTTEHRLVLCQDEDCLVVWAIDGVDIEAEMQSLLRYFETSQSLSKVIGTYTEQGFRGFKYPNEQVSNKSRFK